MPFKVIVKNVDGTVNSTFLGNDRLAQGCVFLDLSDSSQQIIGRTAQVTYSVVFNSEVYISFDGTNKDTTYATGGL